MRDIDLNSPTLRLSPQKIMNLTPHPITFQTADGERTTFPSEGLARVASTPGAEIAGDFPIPLFAAPVWGAVEGLPPPENGVLIVVSALVAGRVHRADVCSPGTGPADGAVRDAGGRIEAVTRLISSAEGMEA